MRVILSRFVVFAFLALFLGLGQACKKSTTEDKKIFTDDFNRSDGHPGADYTLYLPSLSTFNISSQRLYPIYNGAPPSAFYNTKITASHTTSATFSLSGVAANTTYTGTGFIVGRSDSIASSNNAYVCGYYSSNLILGKYSGGILTTYGTVGLHQLVSGVSDTLTFTLDGSSLKCALTGGSTITVSVVDTSYSSGYDGLSGGSAAGNYLYIDNLSIQKL